MTEERWRVADLLGYAKALLAAAGFEPEKAEVTARLLVEADLLGHTTHGLQLLAPYIGAAEAGSMRLTGEPTVIADRPAALTWDGERLPGVWLTDKALGVAIERARSLGTAMVAIRRSHHIACLAAFLTRATDAGMMAIITSSDPSVASVAPFGGRQAALHARSHRHRHPDHGRPGAHRHQRVDHHQRAVRPLCRRGQADAACLAARRRRPADRRSDASLTADPPGSILPVGGLDHGHKGYGLGADDRGPDPGALRLRPVGGAQRVGCVGDGPGDRSGLLRRARRLCAGDRLARRRGPRQPATPRRRAGPRAGRERPGRSARRWRTVSSLYPGIMAKLGEVAAKHGVTPPKPI